MGLIARLRLPGEPSAEQATAVGQAALAGPVGVHEVDVVGAGVVGRPGDGASRVGDLGAARRPDRGDLVSGVVCKSNTPPGRRINEVDVRASSSVCVIGDLVAVGGPDRDAGGAGELRPAAPTYVGDVHAGASPAAVERDPLP